MKARSTAHRSGIEEDRVRRKELRRLLDPHLLRNRAQGRSEAFDSLLGSEEVDNDEPVRSLAGCMKQQAVERQVAGRLDPRLAGEAHDHLFVALPRQGRRGVVGEDPHGDSIMSAAAIGRLTGPDRGRDDPTMRRVSVVAITAVGGVVCGLIAVLLDRGPSDTSSALAIQSHFYDAHVRVELSAFFWAVGTCFLLVFAAAFAARVRGSEMRDASLLARVVVPAAAVLVGLQLAGEAAWFTLARQPEAALKQGLHEAWLYHDLGDSFFALENFPAFILVSVGAVVALRAVLPRWVAWISLTAAAVLLVNAFVQLLANDSDAGDPLGAVAQIFFFAWLLAIAAAWHEEPGGGRDGPPRRS